MDWTLSVDVDCKRDMNVLGVIAKVAFCAGVPLRGCLHRRLHFL